MRIEACIFDMDGLLLDTERLAYEAFLATCEHLSLGDLSEVFKACLGTNLVLGRSILAKELAGLIEVEVFIEEWRQRELEIMSVPLPVKEGALDLLTELKEQSIPLAVATSSLTEKAHKKLSDAGLIDFFSVLVGGDQVSNSKPDPEIYLMAADRLQVQPENCMAFEDSDNGVKSAVGAGMTVIQVPDLVEPSHDVLKLGHRVMGSLKEVRSMILMA